MKNNPVILNTGDGAWAFEKHAQYLAPTLWLDIAQQSSSSGLTYLLYCDDDRIINNLNSFIPIDAIKTASDKRLIAQKFQEHNVPSPETVLIENKQDLIQFLNTNQEKKWCLKWAIGCGGKGHQLVNEDNVNDIADNYPLPFVVQG